MLEEGRTITLVIEISNIRERNEKISLLLERMGKDEERKSHNCSYVMW